MTEEIVRRAKSVARSFPDEPRVVGVVTPGGRGADALEAVAELASGVGASRRTLLANLVGGEDGLDGRLGIEREEGLQAVLAEGKRLGQVAVQPGTRPYLYLPAGARGPAAPSAGGALPDGVLAGLEALSDKLREAGGTLLLHLSREHLDNDGVTRLLDGVVLVGEAAEPVELPPELPELGRIALPGTEGEREATPETEPPVKEAAPEPEPPVEEAVPEPAEEPAGEASPPEDEEPAPEGPAPAGEESRSGWRRHRKRAGPPWGKIAAGAAVILLLAGGWWLLARGVGGDGGSPAGTAGAPGADEPAAAAAGSDTAPAGDRDGAAGEGPAGTADGTDEGSLARVVASAPEAPFSVMVASYSTWDDAVSSAEAWNEDGEALYFVAPTPVRGALYYRVLAGALASRQEARSLMERLVETGRKESAVDWHVRPAGLAFRLGVHGTAAGAERAREDLAEQGIPAYALRAASGGDTAHVLYAGAYGSREQAGPLRQMLEDAGRPVELVRRRGAPGR